MVVIDSPIVISPPPTSIGNYPVMVTIASIVIFSGILAVLTKRFDPTGGTLMISLMVVLGFLGAVVFCLLYTIPNDEITSAAAGGLVAGFGAVIAFWLNRLPTHKD
jgi:hypothetical protein